MSKASRFPEEVVDELERLTSEREKHLKQEPPSTVEARQARIDDIVATLKAIPTPKKGDIVAGVRLMRIIGKGNFGVVWQGDDQETGEFRAVKIFDTDRLGLGLTLYHFRRGVRAMLHLLNAPDRPDSIIRIYKTEDAGLSFSMTYVEGRDLSNISRRGWSLNKKLEVFKTVCDAVAFAHNNGVLHRDIKPANIVMTVDEHPVLTDFDIADLLYVKTLSTQASGTVSYAAPEQLSGHARRDPTCDIFSLGRLVHFLLIERDPDFIFEKVPSLDDLNSAPDGLVRIIRKCTMRSPDDRYASISHLKADLARYDSDPGSVGVAHNVALGSPEAELYRILFTGGISYLFDVWNYHPTPQQVLDNETLDDLFDNNIQIDDNEFSQNKIIVGGPPYKLGRLRYEQYHDKYRLLRERLMKHPQAKSLKPPDTEDPELSGVTYQSPLALLREAIRAVPPVKYALGIAGIVSAIAIIVSFRIDLRIAVFGTIVMLILMSMLVIFARLSKSAPKHLTYPSLILVYFSLLLTIATASLLFTSVFFQRPIDLKYWVTGSDSNQKGSGDVPKTEK